MLGEEIKEGEFCPMLGLLRSALCALHSAFLQNDSKTRFTQDYKIKQD